MFGKSGVPVDKKFEMFAKEQKNKKLFETEDFFQKNSEQCIRMFQENFCFVCKKIGKLQQRGALPELYYLKYTLRLTSFVKRDYSVEIRVYDKEWYLDQHQAEVGTFDVSFLFEKFTELWEELLSVRKRYAGKVSSREIEAFMVTALPNFYTYVVLCGRFGISSCIKEESYKEIWKGEDFEINIGEYMGHTEAVHKEKKKKDREYFVDWLKQRLEYEYAFEDLTGMDFSGEDLSEIDFRYSDLSNTVLRGTDLQDSLLFGTRFCGADMERVDLKYCLLYEADFTGANLKDAIFRLANPMQGYREKSGRFRDIWG